MFARSAATTAQPTMRGWMSITLALMLIVSFFSSALLAQRASAQGADTGLAEAVPASTVMYIGINLDQESDQWQLAYDLLDRSGIESVAASETGATTEEIGDVAEESNITGHGAIVFTDADSLMSYSSTDLTATAMDTTMEAQPQTAPEVPEGFALVMQPEDPTALAQQFVQMATDEAETSGATLQTVEYNGVTITYWEGDATKGEIGTATAEVDGTVVLATRAADIEPIIDTVQGNTENLTTVDGFNNVSNALPADTMVFGYMNMEILVDAMMADPTLADTMPAFDPAELETARGHMGWAVYASDNGFHMDTVTIPNDPSAIQTDMAFTPSMAAKMPADVMLFGNGNNVAGSGIIEMIESQIQMASSQTGSADAAVVAAPGTPDATTAPVETTPAATPTVDEVWAMFEQQLGFNPKTELLEKLDGEFAVAAGVYGLDAGFPQPGFLFVSGTSDAATLEQTSTTITNMVAQMAEEGTYTVSSRPAGDGELTVITVDSSQTSGIPVVIEYGVVGDELIIGTPEMINEYVEGTAPKLADDANYQQVMDLLPSENLVSVGYLNVEGQVLPLLDFAVQMLNSSSSTLDNHEACGEYTTQAEAQDAYDADPGGLWQLDMDFDGEACEDFFATDATVEASPVSVSSQIKIPAAGSVTWIDGDMVRTNSILVIAD